MSASPVHVVPDSGRGLAGVGGGSPCAHNMLWFFRCQATGGAGGATKSVLLDWKFRWIIWMGEGPNQRIPLPLTPGVGLRHGLAEKVKQGEKAINSQHS